ncbi:hypothetical protein Efla_001131 [Eimeria flavescens]
MLAVNCSLYTVYREMIYDQFARVLFPGCQLRRFVEIPVPEERFPGTRGNAHERSLEALNSLPIGLFNLPLPGSNSTSQLSSQLSVPGSPGDFHAVQYPEDRWVTHMGTVIVWGDSISSPRSPFPAPVTSPASRAHSTEVPRLQRPPSPGVPANEVPPSSAESSSQESAGEDPPAAPPAPSGDAGMIPRTSFTPMPIF